MRLAPALLMVASGCAAAPPPRSDVIDVYPGAFTELALLEREVLDRCSTARDCARPEPELHLVLSISVDERRVTAIDVTSSSTDDAYRRCAVELVTRHRFSTEAPARVPLTIEQRWPELRVDPPESPGAGSVACVVAAHHRALARCTADHETRGEVVVVIEHAGDGRAILHDATPEVTRGLQAAAERSAACVTETLSSLTLPTSLGPGPWTVRLSIGP